MGINKVFKDTLIIAWMKSYPDFRRNPLTLMLLSMINAIPLFFMLMFSSGENMIVHGLIGAMISSVAFAGLISGIQDISWDRYVKIRQIIVAMPVHPASYALGIALAPLLISIPSLILFGAITAFFGFLNLEILVWIIPVLLTAWAAMSTMGFMISTYLFKANPMILNNLSIVLGIAFIFIPPVYFSEAQLGGLSWIAIIIPTSNAAGLIRSYVGLLPLSTETVIIRWALLIVMTLIFITLISLKSKWRED
jgi:hypothetical protein